MKQAIKLTRFDNEVEETLVCQNIIKYHDEPTESGEAGKTRIYFADGSDAVYIVFASRVTDRVFNRDDEPGNVTEWFP